MTINTFNYRYIITLETAKNTLVERHFFKTEYCAFHDFLVYWNDLHSLHGAIFSIEFVRFIDLYENMDYTIDKNDTFDSVVNSNTRFGKDIESMYNQMVQDGEFDDCLFAIPKE